MLSPFLEKQWSIDSYGTGPSQIRKPLALTCLPNDSIVLADALNYRLQLLNSDGENVVRHTLVDCAYGTQLNPGGLALTCHGEVAVVDCDERAVHVYQPCSESATFKLKRSWLTGSCSRVTYSDITNAALICQHPFGLAVNEDGHFYVTDAMERSINVFDSYGEKLLQRFSYDTNSVAYKGTPTASRQQPFILVDNNDHVYVSDQRTSTVRIYNVDGRMIGQCGAPGKDPEKLYNPTGMCWDTRGHLIVADTGNHRISLFSKDGLFIRHLVTNQDGVVDPRGVNVDSHDRLIVACWNESRVFCFK